MVTLLFSAQLIAQTDNVTFRVDMTGVTIGANGVHVVGTFNGFDSNANLLTQEGATNIYSATIALNSGSWYEYKFIDDNNYDNVENPSQPCAGTNGNRYLYVNNSNTDITLEVVPYNGCNAPGTGFTATFNVDLTSEGSISADNVHMTGTFNGFNTTVFPVLNVTGLIASTTFRLPSPADYDVFFDYKFLNGNNFGVVETPAATCSTVDATNRKITLSNSNIVVNDIFNGCTTQMWNGSADTNYANTANWSLSTVPVSLSDKIEIPNGLTNYPTIATGTSLTVDSINLESGSSLIADGTSTVTGNITYNRNINFVSGNLKGWFLMASPVVGQVYNDTYVIANDIAINGTNRGISTYNTSGDDWSYLQGAASGTFSSGKGYAIKKNSVTGAIAFTGTLNTNDAGTDFTLSNADNGFNLLGNPYTSFISSATLLGNAALSENQSIWVYNETLGTNGTYEVKTFANNFTLAPGQGFFVKSNVAGGTVNFVESNQSHNADTFQKSAKTEVKLQISVDGFKNYTKIEYLNTATKGFDNGYEGEIFNKNPDSFAIYSQLLEDNIGKNYQVQSLPVSEMESTVIPIGLRAISGKEITFSVENLNLPENLNVFIEDSAKNSFTNLNEGNYKVTLERNLDGVGRLFLHTSSKTVLSVDDASELDNISMYKSNTSTLRIIGLQQGNATMKLYNILGKQMMITSFVANGVQEIALPNLAEGVYIVQLETETGTLNKKIILE